jgi:hypothetical protein
VPEKKTETIRKSVDRLPSTWLNESIRNDSVLRCCFLYAVWYRRARTDIEMEDEKEWHM